MNEEEREDQIFMHTINNGGFNLNQPGNQGRYTRSHHFQTIEEWEEIFVHLMGTPNGVYDTGDLLHNMVMQQIMSGQNFEYDLFPEITYIPLPCSMPNFRRCILQVEAVDLATGHLTGTFIPIEVTYHDNHPIAQQFTRTFEVNAHYPPSFQMNEDLILMTTCYEPSIRRMCECLTKGGSNFAEFDEMEDPNRNENANLTCASRHILPDPVARERANATVARMDPFNGGDMSLEQSQRLHEVWRSIVFPEATIQQRRDSYARYAADQINMHRYLRIHWAREYPDHANPFMLPFENYVPENNPIDRNHALQWPVNQYIQALYDGQNNSERARIAATDVRLREIQIPINPAEAL